MATGAKRGNRIKVRDLCKRPHMAATSVLESKLGRGKGKVPFLGGRHTPDIKVFGVWSCFLLSMHFYRVWACSSNPKWGVGPALTTGPSSQQLITCEVLEFLQSTAETGCHEQNVTMNKKLCKKVVSSCFVDSFSFSQTSFLGSSTLHRLEFRIIKNRMAFHSSLFVPTQQRHKKTQVRIPRDKHVIRTHCLSALNPRAFDNALLQSNRTMQNRELLIAKQL